MKKDRLNRSDEQRERQMINDQIERAAALDAQDSDDEDDEDEDSDGKQPSTSAAPLELIRNEGEKVKLFFSFKKPAATVNTRRLLLPPRSRSPLHLRRLLHLPIPTRQNLLSLRHP
ncbi:hypothetical protein FRB91_011937 [Serendipita sp. 411]|nr:hypothetical protein FRB91_011937 [Serendipita sp. 411]